jgi:hypothetical protein
VQIPKIPLQRDKENHARFQAGVKTFASTFCVASLSSMDLETKLFG